MYAVFDRTLQTDQAKAFVRMHDKDFDAQKICAATKAHAK